MKIIERVGRALAKEEGYAYDGVPYDERARVAIEAVKQHLSEQAFASKFLQDKDALLCAVEELDDALAKVDA